MHPAQQQGLRTPSLSSVCTRSTCWLLVSAFLTEIVQQIHSLRASGVISSHAANATGSPLRTFRKSAGSLCTVPLEILFWSIKLLYQILKNYFAEKEGFEPSVPYGTQSFQDCRLNHSRTSPVLFFFTISREIRVAYTFLARAKTNSPERNIL